MGSGITKEAVHESMTAASPDDFSTLLNKVRDIDAKGHEAGVAKMK